MQSLFYESHKQIYDCHIWKKPNFPLHLHKQLEFVYNAGGSFGATVEDVSYELEEGDCLLLFPNQIHGYHSTGICKMVLIIADMDYIGEFEEELTGLKMQSPLFSRKELSIYGQQVLELITQSAQDAHIPYRLDKGLLTVLLSDIFSHIQMVPGDQAVDLNTMQRILQYIDMHLAEPLDASTVSKAMGISTCYLSHIFSKQLHMTYTAYVRRKRLDLVCNLLDNTQKSITQITFDAGFSSMRCLQRSFHQEFGISPAQWRSRDKASPFL